MDTPLQQRINLDLKAAMLAGDERKKTVLRLLNSAIQYDVVVARTDGRNGELSEGDMLKLVRKEIKQHNESLSEAKAAGREDLVAEQLAELEILQGYAPDALSREQVAELARQTIAETGATSKKQMGVVMKALLPKVGSNADGSLVQDVVRELLP